MSKFKLNDEQLIELVRKHSVLYNVGHPKYMDNKLKDNVWNVIGRQLRVDGPYCKSRWNNMRDQYRRRLRRNEIRASKGEKLIKAYKYSQQLGFLKPYLKDNIGSNSTAEYENTDRQDDDNEDDDSYTRFEDPVDFVQVAESPGSEESASSQTPNPTDPLMEYLLKKQEAAESPHPIDAFLSGVAPTLKTLTPYQQHMAKTEIFAVVQKYEMQLFRENPELQDGSSAAKNAKLEP